MQKTFFILMAACWLLSCNKDNTEIEVPPFSVYPNPFANYVSIYVDNQITPQSNIDIKILDGKEKEVVKFDGALPGSNFTVDMSKQEKGMYYVEMELEGKTFNLTVLKAE